MTMQNLISDYFSENGFKNNHVSYHPNKDSFLAFYCVSLGDHKKTIDGKERVLMMAIPEDRANSDLPSALEWSLNAVKETINE